VYVDVTEPNPATDTPLVTLMDTKKRDMVLNFTGISGHSVLYVLFVSEGEDIVFHAYYANDRSYIALAIALPTTLGIPILVISIPLLLVGSYWLITSCMVYRSNRAKVLHSNKPITIVVSSTTGTSSVGKSTDDRSFVMKVKNLFARSYGWIFR
jgi:hypothetical protein